MSDWTLFFIALVPTFVSILIVIAQRKVVCRYRRAVERGLCRCAHPNCFHDDDGCQSPMCGCIRYDCLKIDDDDAITRSVTRSDDELRRLRNMAGL